MTTKNTVNPWSWQEKFGFVHGVDVRGAERLIFASGQVSVDSNGTPCHAGDMVGQINQVFNNLETVLKEAGSSLGDVVRLTYYATDVDALLSNWAQITDRLKRAGCEPASSMVGVTRLSAPAFMLEVEATAAL